MVAIKPKERKDPIEELADGNVLFRVPHLIPHMTAPDRVEILAWHIREGDIVAADTLLVHFEFLGDDWYVTMPPLEYGPLRVVKIEAGSGQIVHLHDPLIIWERVLSTV
jgi:hypothetical protein